MLYIGNNCVSTRMYEKLNLQFNQPLCWGRLTYTDFKKLITQWDDINFDIINISRLNESHIIIDEKIDFYYQHYKYDKNFNTPTKKNIDIYYNKIYSYIFNKYFERMKRMDKADKRTYILHQQNLSNEYQVSDNDCLDFIYLPTDQQKILITSNKNLLKYDKIGISVLYDNKNRSTGEIADMIIKKKQGRNKKLYI